MMRCLVASVVALLVASASGSPTAGNSAFHCVASESSGSVCYIPECADAIAAQIEREFNAAFSYMYMGAHFDDSRRGRPGIAHFLYDSASEERSHAIMMLDYLNMRGVLYNDSVSYTIESEPLVQAVTKSPDYDYAIEAALQMEISVTSAIYHIIEVCGMDMHAADYFTEPILTEQHDGIRKLKGALQRFADIKSGHEGEQSLAMAEWIFDQEFAEHGL